MDKIGKIITVGLSAAWDITCMAEGLNWGQHKELSERSVRPAGKALNVSWALAWMGQNSIAAGLWGREDIERMRESVRRDKRLIDVKLTAVPGRTRENITVIDTAKCREMHLRDVSKLASKKSLKNLKSDLRKIVTRRSICVFAGAMPEKKLWGDVGAVMDCCLRKRARLVIDASGVALRQIIKRNDIWLIKPNVEELCELLGEKVVDNPVSLARAGRGLLGKVGIVLISRGKKGAVAVTESGVWQCTLVSRGPKALLTVACGDYLLAGFLKALKEGKDIAYALGTAVKAGTARAWGLVGQRSWRQVERRIKVKVEKI